MDLVKEYYLYFEEMPPLLQTVDYDNPIYIELLKKALETKIPIEEEDLENIKKYDIVNDKKIINNYLNKEQNYGKNNKR